MSLESGTRIADLVATNPVGATDFASQGDDHIRLIKACLQGSFPSLGATAVTATAEELNGLHSLTASKAIATNSSGIAVASSTSDAELAGLHSLTASRAVVTTAGGILSASAVTTTELGYVSGVTSAIQTQLGALSSSITGLSSVYQPLDSDLTSLAALTTASYGRDFNTLANDAALAAKIAALVPTWTGLHTFGAKVAITEPASGNSLEIAAKSSQYGVLITAHAGTNAMLGLEAASGGYQWDVRSDNGGAFTIRNATLSATIGISVSADTNPITSVNDAGTMRAVGFRSLPELNPTGNTTLDHSYSGKMIRYTGGGGSTLTTYSGAAGDDDVITILNNSSGNQTLAIACAGTLRWFSGTNPTDGSPRTLASGAVVTLKNLGGSNIWWLWGTGIS